ncbi:tRNA (adenosine(37)-N6)-threonylcarbamoyltransferase complex dimerization subunit type 1 TsaB [Gillisia sp. M10.2A]|uniref:tRNA (Adenosine(37)-N6)-threonylcarbamoyltransferase complex dimerization subunit type 1 TsaB n=1 Tax=Gillisia lutea TaxID=2909668 RepID=A0ABS9EFH0_9FLAO|nr:tRNA (adenosine(37)-N6)-threonylcarbamoyltransferase complex dimerization subunit type 1 TsaB [Gillisia lutea]MCF4100158.1 tRNA (adenosine(37)-N6)-threonylcarbamoyltransferase complex dimerization subunit type 1 TsaB [Gillisia lutea]
MPKILCIETASTNCSVAVSVDGKVLSVKEDYNLNYSHAERLHLFIEEVLVDNNIKLEDLDAIAVSKGPGSYTGLRIGVSAAKGLCFSHDIPLISVPTLTALGYQVDVKAMVIPMLDARRMEVYAGVFDAERNQVQETAAIILQEDSFKEFLDQEPVYFIGSGVEKFSEICTHPHAYFVKDKLPSAREMGPLATKKFKISDFEDVAYFEPFYLKDFIAG